ISTGLEEAGTSNAELERSRQPVDRRIWSYKINQVPERFILDDFLLPYSKPVAKMRSPGRFVIDPEPSALLKIIPWRLPEKFLQRLIDFQVCSPSFPDVIE